MSNKNDKSSRHHADHRSEKVIKKKDSNINPKHHSVRKSSPSYSSSSHKYDYKSRSSVDKSSKSTKRRENEHVRESSSKRYSKKDDYERSKYARYGKSPEHRYEKQQQPSSRLAKPPDRDRHARDHSRERSSHRRRHEGGGRSPRKRSPSRSPSRHRSPKRKKGGSRREVAEKCPNREKEKSPLPTPPEPIADEPKADPPPRKSPDGVLGRSRASSCPPQFGVAAPPTLAELKAAAAAAATCVPPPPEPATAGDPDDVTTSGDGRRPETPETPESGKPRRQSRGRGKERRSRKDSEKYSEKYSSGQKSPSKKASSAKKKTSHSSPTSHSSRKSRRRRSRERETTPLVPALSAKPSNWIKSSPAEKFYMRKEGKEVVATEELKLLHQKFKSELVERAERIRAGKPKYEPPARKTKLRTHQPAEMCQHSESSSSDEDLESSDEEDTALEELEKKRQHPDRLHPELWFNDPREMNDGPLCRCSAKARRSGIRHGIYVGEEHLASCDPHSNNAGRLHHYKVAMRPLTNFLTESPTVIEQDGCKYVFEGFSLLSHKPLPPLPSCKVIRFNYEYTVLYVEEEMPPNFTVHGLELFARYLMEEVLELVDVDWRAHSDDNGCPLYHFLPRFAKVSKDPEEGKELLSLHAVLEYLLASDQVLVDADLLASPPSSPRWQALADRVKSTIVTCPGMKPSSVRVDQLDREHVDGSLDAQYPVIVHFGVRPPQLSYAGNPHYQRAWRDYVKYRHLLANKPKVRYIDRHKLKDKEMKLQEMRMENDLKRDVTVVISSKGFYRTGLRSDIVQHAMLLPVLVCHLRFHDSLSNLEDKIGYTFKDRYLLQLALTHPSYRENFGTNPDHARNSLTNCGLRQPQYGDRRIHYMNTRKRGINTLINIMSRFGQQQESASSIHHNERLEFLGDAVVEFLSSIHLFYMFPDLEEGGLATYRAAIVQNQHLAVLAKKLHLEKFMLYAHGSDLCHDLELRHAMANCFEALMGALFLDDGIETADKVFSDTLFPEPELQEVWKNYPLHPLQEQEPGGDRKWIETVPLLQRLRVFEEQIGIEFNHIRLLARALTHRSLGFNNLTLGSNQRLEFLGDTVLQLVASEYLYRHFPQHHEGHLSLLRSSLVNNRTQAVVCGDLGMVEFAIYPYFKVQLKAKDKADLLEAFLGALYVDKDLGFCREFCKVCFFPRLQHFIMNQDWNDPKSKLQQCCLTLRSMDGGEPDIPTYKVIECKGPTNTRVYTVAVYFQGNRLAVGSGHSIQQAEMDAASNALKKSKDLFPQLRHQKRAIERSLKQGGRGGASGKRRRSARVVEGAPGEGPPSRRADAKSKRRRDPDER